MAEPLRVELEDKMNWPEKIAAMSLPELKALEENAVATAAKDGPSTEVAKNLLELIPLERARRKDVKAQATSERQEAIRAEVSGTSLYNRACRAFTEMPPADWELEPLRLIAEHPGLDFNEIARRIGKRDGGYINLAVGSLASAREHYFGEAPPSKARKGEKNYSSMIVDFTEHGEGKK